MCVSVCLNITHPQFYYEWCVSLKLYRNSFSKHSKTFPYINLTLYILHTYPQFMSQIFYWNFYKIIRETQPCMAYKLIYHFNTISSHNQNNFHGRNFSFSGNMAQNFHPSSVFWKSFGKMKRQTTSNNLVKFNHFIKR